MKKNYNLCMIFLIISLLSSCNSIDKVQGDFINEEKSEKFNLPVFFSFKNDSLFVKFHQFSNFLSFKLTYDSEKIIAFNESDSLKIEIVPRDFTYYLKFKEPFISKEFEIKKLNKRKYLNQLSDGYWLCIDSPYLDEVWLKLKDEKIIIYTIENNEIDNWSFRQGSSKKIIGNVINLGNNKYFDFQFPKPSTHIIDVISNKEIQVFSNNKFGGRTYSHFYKEDFNNLPVKLRSAINQELDSINLTSNFEKWLIEKSPEWNENPPLIFNSPEEEEYYEDVEIIDISN